MRVRAWFVDGFGVFRDHEVANLVDGLTLLAGPNEAGKSTLLAFLRGMLFGFPDGRSREPRYPPLRGGRHGGRIVLASPDGDYIVERHANGRDTARVTGPDGRPVEDGRLTELLGGADDSLFRSVFAFSLTELQSFDSLGAEGIRDRIFSAGIAGAGRSARQTSEQLQARAARLLRPRGQAVITELIGELDAVRRRLEDAQRAAAEYGDRLEDEETCRVEIQRLGTEMQRQAGLRDRHLLLLDLWPHADELQTASRELAELDAPADLPPDAEVRLAATLEQVSHARRALDELVESHDAVSARRATTALDPAVAAVAADVEQLHETLSLHRNQLQELPAARRRVVEAKERLVELLTSLGPDWDEARVEGFDGSIPTQEEVRAWQRRMDACDGEVSRLRGVLETATRRGDESREARDRLAEVIAEDPPDSGTLDEHAAALRRVRAATVELASIETGLTAADHLERDRDRARRMVEASLVRPLPAWPVWTVRLAALVAVLAAGVVALARDWAPAGILGATGLALAIGAAVLHGIRTRRRVVGERQQHGLEEIEAERDAARRTTTELLERREAIERQMAADCQTLSIDPPPAPQALEARQAELERRRLERLQLGEVRARLAEADARVDEAIAAVRGAADELHAAEAETAERHTAWSEWKRARDIPDALSPQGVLDYFGVVRQCRGSLQALRAAQVRCRELSERAGAWEDRARATLTRTGDDTGAAEDELIERVLGLRRRCRAELSARADAEALDREIADLATRRDSARAALRRAESARDGLLAEIGADDEASFRERIEAHRRRAQLESRVRELESLLAARVGRGQGARPLRDELDQGTVDAWREAAAAATAAIADLQRERDLAVGRHRDAQRARTALEASADVATLETESESLRAELASAVDTWRTATLARALIDRTLREFERNRQPAVLAEASRSFGVVTRGRYERIVQEKNARDLAVLDARGGRRAVDALSRGTAEQLYLCIRLALADEFARRSQPLPLVMDDVFVNFDPERARAVAEVVAEFARSHQVLVFTCHPSTRDLLLEVDPAAGLVELQQVGPVPSPAPRRARTGRSEAARQASLPDLDETPATSHEHGATDPAPEGDEQPARRASGE